MSNALITSHEDYYAALAAEAQGYSGGGSNKLFLKFNGNDGGYTYGADDTPLAVETQAAMDLDSFKRGWICWVGGKVKEEIMLGITEGKPPVEGHLPDHGPYGPDDGWSEQKTIEFTTIEGEALNLLFQANNKSKSRALEAVIKDFGRQFKLNPGMVPVVSLGSSTFEFTPKEGGRKLRKHAPSFRIVGWITREEFESYKEGDPSDYEQALTGGDEPAALPAPEPEVEDAVVEPVAAEPARRGGRRETPLSAGAGRAANATAEAPKAAPAAEAPAPAAAPTRGRRF